MHQSSDEDLKVWEHYGLDKPPAPPKEMDVNYEFNLITAKPSSKSYATPEGYPTLDVSNDNEYQTVKYDDMKDTKDTHYTRWMAENNNG